MTKTPTVVQPADQEPFYRVSKEHVNARVNHDAMQVSYQVTIPGERYPQWCETEAYAREVAAEHPGSIVSAIIPLMPALSSTGLEHATEYLRRRLNADMRTGYAPAYLAAEDDAKRQGWYVARMKKNGSRPDDTTKDSIRDRAHYYLREILARVI